jgi:hypothetical protein
MAYELAAAPPVLFRVGRWPHPFNWRLPRAPLDDDNPRDGYRWDDPSAKTFSTLYLATEPLGCFIETLQTYRLNQDFEARVRAETDEPDAGYDGLLTTGHVDPDYFIDRVLGRARVADGATFIDIDHPRTHNSLTAELRSGRLSPQLASLLKHHGITEFDRSVVMHHDRRVTRLLAAHLHETSPSAIAGIRYESRLYRTTECWAMWDRARDALTDPEGDGLTPAMSALREAAELLDVTLPADVPHRDH